MFDFSLDDGLYWTIEIGLVLLSWVLFNAILYQYEVRIADLKGEEIEKSELKAVLTESFKWIIKIKDLF